jgi:hypothetical protein
MFKDRRYGVVLQTSLRQESLEGTGYLLNLENDPIKGSIVVCFPVLGPVFPAMMPYTSISIPGLI